MVLGSKIKQAADTLDHGSFKVYPWVAFYYSNQEYGGSGDLDVTPVYRRWEYLLRARYGLADWAMLDIEPRFEHIIEHRTERGRDRETGLNLVDIALRTKVLDSDGFIMSLRGLAVHS